VISPRGFASERKTTVVPRGEITAPLKKGQVVADLVVTVKGMPATKLPLVAGAAVAEAGSILQFWNWLKSLVGF
jgi:D-alanyl-D-alanine carboxypeptidase (penicillin-binding protein 5/6)